jgi:hypothetical protein
MSIGRHNADDLLYLILYFEKAFLQFSLAYPLYIDRKPLDIYSAL